MESLKQTDIVIFVTFDDAFNKLSDKSKVYIVENFGSRHINELQYRSAWAFVGQKGVQHPANHEMVSQCFY